MQSGSAFAALLVLFLLIALFSTACVSVNLPAKKSERSEGVSFRVPDMPFIEAKSQVADRLWQNRGNGNSISYFSSCNDPGEPTLENFTQDLLSYLENQNVLAKNSYEYNGRDAIRTEVEGLADGVKTRVEILAFKKNKCVYSLTYVGVAKSFKSDQAAFKKFIDNFRAP